MHVCILVAPYAETGSPLEDIDFEYEPERWLEGHTFEKVRVQHGGVPLRLPSTPHRGRKRPGNARGAESPVLGRARGGRLGTMTRTV